ncbi:DUF4194 domain-containing protein [Flavitalea sp. BT771]|uniref:DUF4194 domain-containing protein n=1 Tax=Flavitalea sp. BT771 TaxID=3063329 RepID=UPI0026E11866|nr:DUF4194 domain-containing protein [Flavitalea sp. BT771]MDO6433331.1 DUF4194 domain-containing protein [Flavitalea sp. BT771]MDV6222764.1 DUF4194 domain-containing protein [Flavitalea sp. BT771]
MAVAKQNILPYTPVLIKLLKGPVEYLEKSAWEQLMQYQVELTRFLQQLGLVLVLEKDDGYAYLEQLRLDEEDNVAGWIRRIQLGYDESILLVLLRDMMAEFEVGEAGARELIKKRREIKEYAELFFKENPSRVKFIRDLDRLIDKVEELDFIEKVEPADLSDEEKFRIKKIIKAKVDHEILENFKNQLTQYAAGRI